MVHRVSVMWKCGIGQCTSPKNFKLSLGTVQEVRMKSRNTIIIVFLVLLSFFLAILFKHYKHEPFYQYFREVTLDKDYGFHTKEELFGKAKNESEYYRIRYNKLGNPTKIEYFRDGEIKKDPYSGVARIRIQYLGDIQRRVFEDAKGNLISDIYGVYSSELKFDKYGNAVSLFHYDIDGKITRGSDGIACVIWKFDKFNRKTKISYYDEEMRLKEDYNGIASINWAYNNEVNKDISSYMRSKYVHIEMGFGPTIIHSQKLRVSTLNDEIPITCIKYNAQEYKIEQVYLDQNYYLCEDSNGIAVVRWSYSGRGNVVEQSHYGSDMLLKGDADGVASIRWKYNEEGNKIERIFYNAQEKLTEDGTSGVAITRWQYNDDGNAIKESYFDSNNRPKEEHHGIARICWDYWYEKGKGEEYGFSGYKEGRITKYFGVSGKLKERADIPIAIVRWEDKAFRERWYDDEWTRLHEWTFHGVDGKLKGIESKHFLVRIAIVQSVIHSGYRISRVYYLNERRAKMIEQ